MENQNTGLQIWSDLKKTFFWVLKACLVLFAMFVILMAVFLAYEKLNGMQREKAIKQSWNYSPEWKPEYQKMLRDCFSRVHSFGSYSSFPNQYSTEPKFVHSYVSADDSIVIAVSESALITKSNSMPTPPKALDKQAFLCRYNSSTQAFLSAVYSKDGFWIDAETNQIIRSQ